MPRRIIIATAVAALAGCAGAMHGPSADPPVVREDDLRPLGGAQWKGTLRYLDYRTNLKVTIPSSVTVAQSPGDPRAWIFTHEHPDEPGASRRDTVVVAADGRSIDDARVVERRTLPDGTLRLVTRRMGKDNHRDAIFRHTYLIGASRVSIRKEVMPEKSAEYFERSEFAWSR